MLSSIFVDEFSDPQPILDGEFGEVSVPIFLNEVACSGDETTLLSCDRSSRLGFIQENCACDGCAEDLGVRCPGLHSELFYN